MAFGISDISHKLKHLFHLEHNLYLFSLFQIPLCQPYLLAWRPDSLTSQRVWSLDPLANVYFLVGGRLSEVLNHH